VVHLILLNIKIIILHSIIVSLNLKSEFGSLGVDRLSGDSTIKLGGYHLRYCEAKAHSTLVHSTFVTNFSEKLK